MFQKTIAHLEEFARLLPLNLTMLFQNFSTMLEANTTPERPGYAIIAATTKDDEAHVIMLEGVEQGKTPWDEFLFKSKVYDFLTEMLLAAQSAGIEMVPDQDKAIDALTNL